MQWWSYHWLGEQKPPGGVLVKLMRAVPTSKPLSLPLLSLPLYTLWSLHEGWAGHGWYPDALQKHSNPQKGLNEAPEFQADHGCVCGGSCCGREPSVILALGKWAREVTDLELYISQVLPCFFSKSILLLIIRLDHIFWLTIVMVCKCPEQLLVLFPFILTGTQYAEEP